MLTSIRGLTAATVLFGVTLFSAPAMAAEIEALEGALGGAIVNVDLAPVDEASQLTVSSVGTTDPAAPVFVADSSAAELPVSGNIVAVTRAAEAIDNHSSAMAGESGLEISGNVALVSDYRFRGVSFSDGDIALQGGIDVAHSSGFYVGTWASSISGGTAFGELELDVYAGYGMEFDNGVSFDVGLLYYIYPTGDAPGVDTDYFEPYASIGFGLGPVSATAGVAYAWEQDSLGGDDNVYLYTDFEAGLPNTGLTLTAHLGYTDGVFATEGDGTSFDWGLGASYALTEGLSVGVNYVDTEGPSIEDFTDAGFFFTIAYSM